MWPPSLCRLKCHNKCTKEAPSCRISFLPSKFVCFFLPHSVCSGREQTLLPNACVILTMSPPVAKIRRTESVPSDINNPVDRPQDTPHFGTLPKAITKKVEKVHNLLFCTDENIKCDFVKYHLLCLVMNYFHSTSCQDHPPVMNQLDSSSNPSSTTSSTPSSPAPFQQSNPPSATPPPNPSPKGHRDSRFNFPGQFYLSRETSSQPIYLFFILLYKNTNFFFSHISHSFSFHIKQLTVISAMMSFFKSKPFNKSSLPVMLICISPLSVFAKAACYFQHRQQFIFPGELTVPAGPTGCLLLQTVVSCSFLSFLLCVIVFRVPTSSLCPLHCELHCDS